MPQPFELIFTNLLSYISAPTIAFWRASSSGWRRYEEVANCCARSNRRLRSSSVYKENIIHPCSKVFHDQWRWTCFESWVRTPDLASSSFWVKFWKWLSTTPGQVSQLKIERSWKIKPCCILCQASSASSSTPRSCSSLPTPTNKINNIIFIGPESDHWECLSVTYWLTHWLIPV